MGLTDEIKQMRTQTKVEPEVKVESTEGIIVTGLEVGEQAPKEDTPQEPPKDTPNEVLIKIGNRTFKSQSEAIAYAEELERANMADLAFKDGYKAAKGIDPAQTPDPDDALLDSVGDEFEKEVFENPKLALKKALKTYGETLTKKITTNVDKTTSNRRAYEQIKQDTFRDHPELSTPVGQEVFDQMLQRKWNDVANMPDAKKALKIVAEASLDYMKNIASAYKPQTVLPGGPAHTLSPSGSETRVTQVKTEVPVDDFISQMKSLRQRGNKPSK